MGGEVNRLKRRAVGNTICKGPGQMKNFLLLRGLNNRDNNINKHMHNASNT